VSETINFGSLREVNFFDTQRKITLPLHIGHLEYKHPHSEDKQIVYVMDAARHTVANAYYTAPANLEDEALLLALCEARYTE